VFTYKILYLYVKISAVEDLVRDWQNLDWITVVLVGCFLLLAVAKYLFSKRFQEFIILPLSQRYFSIQGKENDIRHPFNWVLFIVQTAVMSLFIAMAFSAYKELSFPPSLMLYLQVVAVYIVFVGVTYFLEKIVGTLLSIEVDVHSHLYKKLAYRNFMALAFFVLNVLFVYLITPSKNLLYACIILFLVFNAIALYSSYKNHRNLIFTHYFYFILYLCALEILPYILLFLWLR